MGKSGRIFRQPCVPYGLPTKRRKTWLTLPDDEFKRFFSYPMERDLANEARFYDEVFAQAMAAYTHQEWNAKLEAAFPDLHTLVADAYRDGGLVHGNQPERVGSIQSARSRAETESRRSESTRGEAEGSDTGGQDHLLQDSTRRNPDSAENIRFSRAEKVGSGTSAEVFPEEKVKDTIARLNARVHLPCICVLFCRPSLLLDSTKDDRATQDQRRKISKTATALTPTATN